MNGVFRRLREIRDFGLGEEIDAQVEVLLSLCRKKAREDEEALMRKRADCEHEWKFSKHFKTVCKKCGAFG